MKKASGIPRIIGSIVVVFLVTLAATDGCAQEKGAPAQEIKLWSYGPVLKDRGAREALMQAVNWAYLTDSQFDDPYLPVFFYPPPQGQDEEILDNYGLEFDDGVALSQLEETRFGEDGFDLALVYSYELAAEELVDGIANRLEQLEIQVRVFEAENMDELNETKLFLAEPDAGINALVVQLVK